MKLFILIFLFVSVVTVYSQASPQKSEDEIRALVKKSLSKDFKVSDEANDSLSTLDAGYIPLLFKMVKKGKPCEQVVIAEMIVDLDKKNKEIIPILVKLGTDANFSTLFNLKEELNCRQRVFWSLTQSADGIRESTKILKDGDTWEKQRVTFAFDDLTETTDYSEGILEAMIDAIPVIAKNLKSKDKVLNDMSYEVLQQIDNRDLKGISELAKKYLDENPRN